MRTTLSIDDHVMTLAKQTAALRHCTLGKLVEDALRQALASVSSAARQRRTPIRLPESGEGGLRAGIDIDSSADLLYVMEKPDDSYGR